MPAEFWRVLLCQGSILSNICERLHICDRGSMGKACCVKLSLYHYPSVSIIIPHIPIIFHHVSSRSIKFHQIPSCSIIIIPSNSIIFHPVETCSIMKHVPSWIMFHCVPFHHIPSCFILFHHVPSCFIMSYFNILQCDLASTLNFCSWLENGTELQWNLGDTANDIVTRCGKCV